MPYQPGNRLFTPLLTCLLAALGAGSSGCSTTPFSAAASMRVEVEVYKGPLSKTPEVQLGEFEGLVTEMKSAAHHVKRGLDLVGHQKEPVFPNCAQHEFDELAGSSLSAEERFWCLNWMGLKQDLKELEKELERLEFVLAKPYRRFFSEKSASYEHFRGQSRIISESLDKLVRLANDSTRATAPVASAEYEDWLVDLNQDFVALKKAVNQHPFASDDSAREFFGLLDTYLQKVGGAVESVTDSAKVSKNPVGGLKQQIEGRVQLASVLEEANRLKVELNKVQSNAISSLGADFNPVISDTQGLQAIGSNVKVLLAQMESNIPTLQAKLTKAGEPLDAAKQASDKIKGYLEHPELKARGDARLLADRNERIGKAIESEQNKLKALLNDLSTLKKKIDKVSVEVSGDHWKNLDEQLAEAGIAAKAYQTVTIPPNRVSNVDADLSAAIMALQALDARADSDTYHDAKVAIGTQSDDWKEVDGKLLTYLPFLAPKSHPKLSATVEALVNAKTHLVSLGEVTNSADANAVKLLQDIEGALKRARGITAPEYVKERDGLKDLIEKELKALFQKFNNFPGNQPISKARTEVIDPLISKLGEIRQRIALLKNLDGDLTDPNRTQLAGDVAKLSAAGVQSVVAHNAATIRSLARSWEQKLTRQQAKVAGTVLAPAAAQSESAVLAGDMAGIRQRQPALDKPLLDNALSNLTKLEEAVKKLPGKDKKLGPFWDHAYYEQLFMLASKLALRMKAKALFWANNNVGAPPDNRPLRISIAAFSNFAAEYSNQLMARADALQLQLRPNGEHRDLMSLSKYLRDSETTDFLNTYTWHRAAGPAISEERFLHPIHAHTSDETADRVRVAERLFADHNWAKTNTVYASGRGEVAMALVKDDIGNWNLKSFDQDPAELVAAYQQLTLAGINRASELVSDIASGGVSDGLSTALQMTSQFSKGQVVESESRLGGWDVSGLKQRSVQQLTALQAEASAAEQGASTQLNEKDKEIEGLSLVAKTRQAELETIDPQGSAAAPLDANSNAEALNEAYGSAKALAEKTSNDAIAVRVSVAAGGAVSEAKESADIARDQATKAYDLAQKVFAVPEPLTVESVNQAMKDANQASRHGAVAQRYGLVVSALVARQEMDSARASQRVQVAKRARAILDEYQSILGVLHEAAVPDP